MALGLDTHESGPFQTFKITTEGFAAIGLVIASVGLPVLHVQQGGYLKPEKAENQTSYLNGADRRR